MMILSAIVLEDSPPASAQRRPGSCKVDLWLAIRSVTAVAVHRDATPAHSPTWRPAKIRR